MEIRMALSCGGKMGDQWREGKLRSGDKGSEWYDWMNWSRVRVASCLVVQGSGSRLWEKNGGLEKGREIGEWGPKKVNDMIGTC
mgnify:CR=1 FL=1